MLLPFSAKYTRSLALSVQAWKSMEKLFIRYVYSNSIHTWEELKLRTVPGQRPSMRMMRCRSFRAPWLLPGRRRRCSAGRWDILGSCPTIRGKSRESRPSRPQRGRNGCWARRNALAISIWSKPKITKFNDISKSQRHIKCGPLFNSTRHNAQAIIHPKWGGQSSLSEKKGGGGQNIEKE